jgi:hypothetical protein
MTSGKTDIVAVANFYETASYDLISRIQIWATKFHV